MSEALRRLSALTTARVGGTSFLSYSRTDRDFAAALQAALERRNRFVWIDTRDIKYTEDWLEAIRRAIESTDVFIFILSPASLKSRHCTYELDHAERLQKRIVPIRWRDVPPEGVPPVLERLQWIPFNDAGAFEHQADELVHTLEMDLDHLRTHTTLLTTAREWQAARRRSLLLRGRSLTEAQRWLAAALHHRDPRPADVHHEFISASHRAKNVRIGMRVLAVVAFFLLAGIGYLMSGQSKAQQLAADAMTQLSIDPELSVLLGLEAAKRASLPVVDDALRTALSQSMVMRVFAGTGSGFRRARYSLDGKMFGVVTEDGKVMLWDTQTSQRKSVLESPRGALLTYAFSADGTLVLAGGRNDTALLWEVRTNRQLQSFETLPRPRTIDGGAFDVSSCRFSPDGRWAIITYRHGATRMWEVASGRLSADAWAVSGGSENPLETEPREWEQLVFSPNGARVAGLTKDGIAMLRHAASGQVIRQLRTRNKARAMAFSGNGSLIAVADQHRVVIFDGTIGAPTHSLDVGARDDALLAFAPDHDALLIDNAILRWRTDRASTPRGRVTVPVAESAYSPTGRYLFGLPYQGHPRVLDADTGEVVAVLNHPAQFSDVAFTPDDAAVLTVSRDSAVRVWELPSGRLVRSLLKNRSV